MSIRQNPDTGPVPLAAAVSELLERSDEYDSWLARLLLAEKASYQRGLADGIILGRRLEAAERDQAWAHFAGPIARGGPSFAETERRRWTLRGEPRTRAEFARPHPDDFKGHDAA